MKIKGENYNFGRVIYLTLIRRVDNAKITQTWTEAQLENTDNITICFDPARDVNLATRIDFYIKRMGDAGIGNNGAYQIANIDVWNIGAAIQEFLDAYHAYEMEGHWDDINTKKYAVVLQVGYKGDSVKTTIFAGHISSFVLERKQSSTSVDNVWHFFCQYPDPQQNGKAGDNKAISGTNYASPDYWSPTQTFLSWEAYLKEAIMSRPREVYTLNQKNSALNVLSFVETNITKQDQEQLMCIVPHTEKINSVNFNKYFQIEYRFSKSGGELKDVKRYWQQQVPVRGWRLDCSSLQKTISGIARTVNCHTRIELEENTGKQIIYIYPPVARITKNIKNDTDFIITDYQNLRNPPQVSANMLHLDMMMEPSIKPGSIIELRISPEFLKNHPHPTFEPNFSMSNTATVFAGANFIGLANMAQDEKKKQAIASAGNIFNTQFVATMVELRGSSHTSEWATKVDCYSVIVNGQEVSA